MILSEPVVTAIFLVSDEPSFAFCVEKQEALFVHL